MAYYKLMARDSMQPSSVKQVWESVHNVRCFFCNLNAAIEKASKYYVGSHQESVIKQAVSNKIFYSSRSSLHITTSKSTPKSIDPATSAINQSTKQSTFKWTASKDSTINRIVPLQLCFVWWLEGDVACRVSWKNPKQFHDDFFEDVLSDFWSSWSTFSRSNGSRCSALKLVVQHSLWWNY